MQPTLAWLHMFCRVRVLCCSERSKEWTSALWEVKVASNTGIPRSKNTSTNCRPYCTPNTFHAFTSNQWTGSNISAWVKLSEGKNPLWKCLCMHIWDCELWTLTAQLQGRIQAMEIRCYRKILCISYKDHVINEEVHAKIQQAIGPHEDFLTIVKRCKLQWYDHVARSSGLAKSILQGTVKGGRRQSRQTKRWEDISKWTGLTFTKSQRAVENREKFRKLVTKSYVVPQQPSQLRDRWWW